MQFSRPTARTPAVRTCCGAGPRILILCVPSPKNSVLGEERWLRWRGIRWSTSSCDASKHSKRRSAIEMDFLRS